MLISYNNEPRNVENKSIEYFFHIDFIRLILESVSNIEYVFNNSRDKQQEISEVLLLSRQLTFCVPETYNTMVAVVYKQTTDNKKKLVSLMPRFI